MHTVQKNSLPNEVQQSIVLRTVRKELGNFVIKQLTKRFVKNVQQHLLLEESFKNSVHFLVSQSELDLILVEGFKHESFPKVELHRPAVGKPLIYPNDPDIIAVATDGELPKGIELPVLDINDAQGVADFVLTRFLAPQSA